MKTLPGMVLAGLCSIAAQTWSVAQEAAPGTAQPTGPGSRPDLVTVQKVTPAPVAGLVGEVEKMVQGGADPDVIKAFIKNWTGRYYVTADQILRLHDLGTSTEILTALIHRSGELQAQAAAAQPAVPTTPSLVTTNPPTATYSAEPAPPAVVYSYPSYPAYTYSYLYPASIWPSYSYRYWSVPYSYGFSHYWPRYRHYDWRHRPFYRHHYPVYSQSWRHHGSHGWRHQGYHRPGGHWAGRSQPPSWSHLSAPGGRWAGRPGFSYGRPGHSGGRGPGRR